MNRGTILITTPKLAGRAHEMIEEAGFWPEYVPPGTQSEDLASFARTTQSQKGPVIAIVSRTLLCGAETIAELPDLRIISKHGAGVDTIDISTARGSGIKVVRASGANARSVAELALGLILATARKLVPMAVSIANGEWDRTRWEGEQISNKTLGLLGFGQIGCELAKIGQAVCSRVIVTDPYADDADIRSFGVNPVSITELQAHADILSLHCPLNDNTRDLIDATFLSGMRNGSILINTARGEVVDESAVLAALKSGQLAGVGLDSIRNEGPGTTELRSHPNAVITPHIGGSTKQALEIVAERSISNIIDYLDGKELRPCDVVC